MASTVQVLILMVETFKTGYLLDHTWCRRWRKNLNKKNYEVCKDHISEGAGPGTDLNRQLDN